MSAEKLSKWGIERLRLAVKAAGVALWSWNVDSDQLTLDERGFHLWGIPANSDVTFEDLSSHIHPADRDRVRAAFAGTRALKCAYEIDFRVLVFTYDYRGIGASRPQRLRGCGYHWRDWGEALQSKMEMSTRPSASGR